MIDIHSHIVFDVDDGPKTREDTRALLTESYRQGVRTIISTSHRRKGMFETPEEKTPYKEIHTALDRLLHLGITPVVAHIERYNCLEKNEERVQEMIDMGCYMQINSSSVLKPRLFGDEQKHLKKRARYFLEKDLVHFVASDMHNLDKRPPYMAEAYRLIKEEYGEKRAKDLFVNHQQLLLADELI